MSFPSLKQSVIILCTITQFCVTSSLAVDNWGQKCRQNQLVLKDLPSIFWNIDRLLGKIKDTVSLRFTSLSFPSKKIVLWEACAYWQWIVSGNDKGQWPVPMTWRRCFSMFIVCYFFIPVLLGIVFLCCKVFYIVKVGSSTLLEDLSFRHPFVLVVGVADIHIAWLVYVAY